METQVGPLGTTKMWLLPLLSLGSVQSLPFPWRSSLAANTSRLSIVPRHESHATPSILSVLPYDTRHCSADFAHCLAPVSVLCIAARDSANLAWWGSCQCMDIQKSRFLLRNFDRLGTECSISSLMTYAGDSYLT